MPRSAPDAAVTLSVLDRLIDADPRNSSEAPATRAQSVRMLRDAVRRDLEWLLNTRQVAFPPPEGLRELNRSVYVYGLPDFTGYGLSSAAAEARLTRQLQSALKFFEPRLAKVKVVPVEPLASKTRAFRFRIEALLMMDPAPEHISFDTVLQLTTNQYEVRDADDLLLYYERELTYLREMGAQFAEKYPKIAARLMLEESKESEDPHVERLIEAFTFLAARVHLKLDDDFPEITEALLGIVYPHFIRPIPSMSIVELHPDPERGKLTTGLKIDRGTMLYSRPVGGVPCKFRTCYDTALWPVSVSAAEWKSPDQLRPPLRAPDASHALRLVLNSAPDAPLDKLDLDSLRFHLTGDSNLVHTLYELLCSKLTRIVVRDPANPKVPPVSLPASAVRPVGFAEDEGMAPYPLRSHIGYRILQEFFALPSKFLFVDVTGLGGVWGGGFRNSAELVFLFSGAGGEERAQRLEMGVSPKTFRLGCVPIVNLFAQTCEPILLDQRKYEYQIRPDIRRPTAVEVFSIDEVGSIDSDTREVVTYRPYYSYRRETAGARDECYWNASRRPSNRPNDDASDMYITLVDRSGRTAFPAVDTLTVRATCTNRNLPARLPFGNEDGDFELEGSTPVKSIVALTKPTLPLRPPTSKMALWHLISHLSLNHLSLVEDGRDALQQILRLYDFTDSPFARKMIDGITDLKSRPHFAPIVSDNGVTFARGTRVELELDEEQFVGGGVYLFASVIERFLALYATLNSFTQLTARTRQRKEVVREWPPRAGHKILV